MSEPKITIYFPVSAIIPTLEVFKEYFDTKYPCTTEENDGSEMPLNDHVKESAYHLLLNYYQKHTKICTDEFNLISEKANNILQNQK